MVPFPGTGPWKWDHFAVGYLVPFPGTWSRTRVPGHIPGDVPPGMGAFSDPFVIIAAFFQGKMVPFPATVVPFPGTPPHNGPIPRDPGPIPGDP